MLKEFKEFALKGNVLDLAIGIIIGAAFGAIVILARRRHHHAADRADSRRCGFLELFVVLKGEGPYNTIAQAKEAGAVTWNVGLFINAVIKFLIVAFAVFLLVKAINTLTRKQEARRLTAAAARPEDVVLLREIRDLLARRWSGRDRSRRKPAYPIGSAPIREPRNHSLGPVCNTPETRKVYCGGVSREREASTRV